MNQVIPENGHVYFIRLGNSSQEYVKKHAIEEKKVFVGYDKESRLEDFNTCISNALMVLNKPNADPYEFGPELDAVKDIFDDDESWKCNDKPKLPPRGKKALRRFALAREGLDYFFTFFDKKLYYGTPSNPPSTIETEDPLDSQDDSNWRARNLEWTYKYVDSKDEIFYDAISGIISRINMFQETVYMLKEDDNDIFSEHDVFFDVIKRRMPSIIDAALNVELGDSQLSSVDPDIQKKVKALAVPGRKDKKALIRNLCNYLHPAAFEKFVDIAFSSQGYMRCSELGGTMKAIDMEYLKFHKDNSYEHFAVQVKSRITPNVLKDVLENIKEYLKGLKCYIVTHGNNEENLKATIKEFAGNSNQELFELMPFQNLINDTEDPRALLAFLVLHIAGREKLNSLLPLITK